MGMQSYLDLGTTEQRSNDAKKTILAGTKMICDVVKTTLGPSGMTKLLTCNNKIKITNDGATILKNLIIDSASAQILIESSVGQDWEEGDGTTTIAVLASSLVEEASKLDNLHPIQIIKGYEIALSKALETLESNSFPMKEEDFLLLAQTTLYSKILRADLNKFGKMCVDAINIIEDRDDLNLINIIKTEGELTDSFLSDGFILDKSTLISKLKNPKILVANTAMDADKIKINGAQVNVKTVSELSKIEDAERERMEEKVNLITKPENEIDVFINRQIMYDHFLQLFKERNVVAIEHADFDGVERLANVLGSKILSTFDSLNDCLGTCEAIENIKIGEKRMIKFSGLKKAHARLSSKDQLKKFKMKRKELYTMHCVLL